MYKVYLIRHFTLHFLTTPVNSLELGNWIAYLDPGVMVHTCSSPVWEILGSRAERLIIAACAERWEMLLIIRRSFVSLPFCRAAWVCVVALWRTAFCFLEWLFPLFLNLTAHSCTLPESLPSVFTFWSICHGLQGHPPLESERHEDICPNRQPITMRRPFC